jgi:hypothetical protein
MNIIIDATEAMAEILEGKARWERGPLSVSEFP